LEGNTREEGYQKLRLDYGLHLSQLQTSERPQIRASDRAVTGIGPAKIRQIIQ